MTMRHNPNEHRDAQPDGFAEYTEATRRRYETARLVATRRYWQRTKPRVAFVPPVPSEDGGR